MFKDKSKKKFEDYLILKGKEKKIIYTIIRSFLFFDRNLFKKGGLTEFIYNKFQPIIGNGKNFRNVTFKENVVVAFFNILNSEKTNNKIYWIGDKNYKITINPSIATFDLCDLMASSGHRYNDT